VIRLDELAARLDAELVGDGELMVEGVCPLDLAGPEHLSFLHNPKYLSQARESQAGAILVRDPDSLPDRNLLVCAEPYLAFARALEIVYPVERPDPGIHPSAVVDKDAVLGAEMSVGPCAVIEAGARVGDRTTIGPGCVIGRDAVIGADCLLHPRVVVEDRCRVGDRCILHAGAVIGSDGYGFATVGGVHHKVPQVGIAVLEDDVELGANACVDRATMGETRVGRGTKVDNLVQIAHNVEIGEGGLLVSMVGISGSTKLGHHVTFAGNSGAAGHLTIGDNVTVGAMSAVYRDLPNGAFVTGIPARPHKEWLKANANLQRLDSLRQRVKELQREVETLKQPDKGHDG
jgi:UDP-3-O-[3-hydroxymyristoyl] glucosamine N-acyltransferase